ncbi:unnamed protein product [Symbiodinium sp. CCMP2456]|nr:unnamed protein product [Symbiodinium sp. CCMP2456]
MESSIREEESQCGALAQEQRRVYVGTVEGRVIIFSTENDFSVLRWVHLEDASPVTCIDVAPWAEGVEVPDGEEPGLMAVGTQEGVAHIYSLANLRLAGTVNIPRALPEGEMQPGSGLRHMRMIQIAADPLLPVTLLTIDSQSRLRLWGLKVHVQSGRLQQLKLLLDAGQLRESACIPAEWYNRLKQKRDHEAKLRKKKREEEMKAAKARAGKDETAEQNPEAEAQEMEGQNLDEGSQGEGENLAAEARWTSTESVRITAFAALPRGPVQLPIDCLDNQPFEGPTTSATAVAQEKSTPFFQAKADKAAEKEPPSSLFITQPPGAARILGKADEEAPAEEFSGSDSDGDADEIVTQRFAEMPRLPSSAPNALMLGDSAAAESLRAAKEAVAEELGGSIGDGDSLVFIADSGGWLWCLDIAASLAAASSPPVAVALDVAMVAKAHEEMMKDRGEKRNKRPRGTTVDPRIQAQVANSPAATGLLTGLTQKDARDEIGILVGLPPKQRPEAIQVVGAWPAHGQGISSLVISGSPPALVSVDSAKEVKVWSTTGDIWGHFSMRKVDSRPLPTAVWPPPHVLAVQMSLIRIAKGLCRRMGFSVSHAEELLAAQQQRATPKRSAQRSLNATERRAQIAARRAAKQRQAAAKAAEIEAEVSLVSPTGEDNGSSAQDSVDAGIEEELTVLATGGQAPQRNVEEVMPPPVPEGGASKQEIQQLGAMGNYCDCCGVRAKGPEGLPQYGSGGTAEYGFAVAKHDRAKMEDAVAVHSDVAGHTCVAVFDGHGGDKAAKLAQELLPKQLDQHLRLASDKKKAIDDAFQAVESCMKQELADEASLSPSGTSSGTVACVALLQEKELLFVNLGDCRAVICDGAKVATKTVDHSPEKNSGEKYRLQQLGVSIDGGYVDGKVQVSRAFGDIECKTGAKISGLICKPEVTVVAVKESTEFVVLATDGIWDALQEQTVLTTARKVLRESRSSEAAAQAVLESAAKVSKADNEASANQHLKTFEEKTCDAEAAEAPEEGAVEAPEAGPDARPEEEEDEEEADVTQVRSDAVGQGTQPGERRSRRAFTQQQMREMIRNHAFSSGFQSYKQFAARPVPQDDDEMRPRRNSKERNEPVRKRQEFFGRKPAVFGVELLTDAEKEAWEAGVKGLGQRSASEGALLRYAQNRVEDMTRSVKKSLGVDVTQTTRRRGDKGKGGNNWKVRHTTSKAAWNSEEGGETTVVLTRLPKTLNAEILLDLLDELFPCAYDYFYLPMDMDKFENQGLAYINFRDHETAVQCQNHFEGTDDWQGHTCERPCKPEWSSIQGYAANIERQQRSDWVSGNIPEDCKPMAFDENGMRLPTLDIFPAADTGKDSRSWRTVSYNNKEEGSKWWKDQWYGGSSSSEQYDGKNGKSHGWYDTRLPFTDFLCGV